MLILKILAVWFALSLLLVWFNHRFWSTVEPNNDD